MAQKENTVVVNKLSGMDSYNDPSSLAENEFAAIFNFVFQGSKLIARPPHKKIIATPPSTIAGCVGEHVFTSPDLHALYYAMPYGRVWNLDKGDTVPTEIRRVTTGGPAISTTTQHAHFAQYLDEEYVVDKNDLFHINYVTQETTSLTAKLAGAGVPNPAFLAYWQMGLWVIDLYGNAVRCKQEVDVLTNPTPFDLVTVGTTAFLAQINKGDGYIVQGVAISNQALVIHKINPDTKLGKTFIITGTSHADFAVKEIAGSVSYLGRSGLAVGEKVFGLTNEGFQFLGLATERGEIFQATEGVTNKQVFAFDSEDVPNGLQDIIQEIEPSNYHLIRSVYEPTTNRYFCSVPVGKTATKNNLVFVYDFSERQARPTCFNNTFAAGLFLFDGNLCYFSDRGEILKMLSFDEISYDEDEFHKLIITKKFDFGAANAEHWIREFIPHIKTFKSPKMIEAYYKVFRTETGGGVVTIETDRAGTSFTDNQHTLKQDQSYKPVRWETLIQDLDNYDYLVFDNFRPQVAVNKQGHAVQFIIADFSTGANEHWEFSGFTLKGHIGREDRG